MSGNHYYIAPYFTNRFFSLEDAKWNVKIAFTYKEAVKYFFGKNEEIFHFIGNKLHSVTPIKVDDFGHITFGKTRKV